MQITAFKKILFTAFLVSAFTQSSGIADNNTKLLKTNPKSVNSQEIKDLLLAIPKELISLKPSNPLLSFIPIMFFDTFMHELGHAIMYMAFPSNYSFEGIHLFTNNKSKPLFDFGKIKFYGTGLDSFAITTIKKNEMYKDCMTSMNGPLTGLSFCLLFLTAINLYSKYSKTENPSSSKNTLIDPTQNKYSPFQIILNSSKLSLRTKRFLINISFVLYIFALSELLYGLAPNSYGLFGVIFGSGDGYYLWKNLISGNKHQNWLTVLSIANAILDWGSYGFLLFQYAKALKSLNQQEQALTNPCPTKNI